MPMAQSAIPPMASTAQAAMPGHVELAEDRLSEVPLEREVEELVGQAEDRPDEVEQEEPEREDDRHRRGEARPDESADGEADAGDRGRIQPEHRDADRERAEIARRRLRRRPEEDADDHDRGHDRDADHHGETALDGPAGSRDRRREEQLQAPLALVGCPAGDERRRGDAHEQDRLGEERQLQEPAGREDVVVGEDRLDHLDDLRDLRKRRDELVGRERDDQPEQPEAPRPTRSTPAAARRARG